ncbi:MAG: FliI/YscN family ATPase [Sedimentisphaerales bacterium]|nr:FliI/YscN family ATPase [Sedimentisphaerales bacterium]
MVAAHEHFIQRLQTLQQSTLLELQGRVTAMGGLIVEADDFCAPVGARCEIRTRHGDSQPAEVIGFRGRAAVLMPLSDGLGISRGDYVNCISTSMTVPAGEHLLGRIINAHGEPIDGKGPLLCQVRRNVHAERLGALARTRIDRPLPTGVRCIDGLTTVGAGQRMGIFSGPGVGKSVLLGMIARFTAADVAVIGLIGERGREVREFIERDLGEEGLRRSVVIVSTSDEPAPLRVQAGFMAATVAEFFRDRGSDVLLLVDSVTRIAMAQRQIGLAMGEPPATKGYTPSVFALLPRLIERCGRNVHGSITGFYTVLVEGDDLSEPVSDAMRSILDGHLWLSRELANRGHYPAIDVLESISRVMVDVADDKHQEAARKLIRLTAVYRDIADLVNIGAYAEGGNAEFDLAVRARDIINQFLQQDVNEVVTYEQTLTQLAELTASLQAMSESMGRVNQVNGSAKYGPKTGNSSRSNSANISRIGADRARIGI